MATITNQTNSTKRIVDIYNTNPSFVPTNNTLLLTSTLNGVTQAVKAKNLILSPIIFDKPLMQTYCPFVESRQYKDYLTLNN